jgi:mannose-6-phosphate isomerase-like protein (cupin superfamily)
MYFHRWLDIIKDVTPGNTLPGGMSRRGITLGDVMLGLHEAFPNLKTTPHTHESAQIAYMLQGRMKMTIGGQSQIIGPGEFAYVPSGVEHNIESLDDYVLEVDIFTPPRNDIAARLAELNS